ncbi:glycerol-3-phosphate acyltransferase, partial [bacterium]|nr:glycerol-3-phosphate acyltransferase [bacterium]
MKEIILIIISYLIGSIPAGFIVGRLKGIDIREHGSGNIGFTNVLRTLGPLPGAVVFATDLAKGIIPVYLSRIFLENEGLPVICGLAAILGHSFTIFLKFKGGKGVLTTTGVFLALAPLPILILL